MQVIDENTSAQLITHELAFASAKDALLAASRSDFVLSPVVLTYDPTHTNRFSVKPCSAGGLLGLKVGSFWPQNPSRGLESHSSTIFLLDSEIGGIRAVVQGAKANAYRTAAADAVAVNYLARSDATTLAIFGTGHQAKYECEAVARVRELTKIVVVGRNSDRAEAFAKALSDQGLPATTADARAACNEADIIVTATPSRSPLFSAEWVKPGTHISSMGSDGEGKQELPPELLLTADLFCDHPDQSLRLGEFQHVRDHAVPQPIGKVIAEEIEGRRSMDAITVFDSSGLAVQDIFIAQRLLDYLDQCKER
jgi:ornithine cyclodeaminase